jgi:hypothetical protein
MHRSTGWSRRLSVAVTVISALAGKAFAQQTFTDKNATPIVIPAPGSSAGSEITVTGLGNSITPVSGSFSVPNDVTVTVFGLSETKISDVDLVLVGPTGAALVLMGNCGTASGGPLTLLFDDQASSLLPQSSVIDSGSYMPTQFGSVGSFPSPGPGTAYNSPAVFGTSSFDQTFAFTNPNGNWWLYAMDPDTGDTGEISNGWELQVTAVPEPASVSLVLVAAAGLTRRRGRCVLRG